MAVTVARAFSAWSICSLAVLLLACEKPTEIVVTVDTELTPAEVSEVVVEITGPDGKLRESRLHHGADTLPATVGLVHEGGPLGPITIRAVGWLGSAEVVEREAMVSFRPERIVRLQLNLLRRCVGESCSASMTCGETGCRPRQIAPEELVDWNGVPERIAPTSPDAGTTTDGETGPPDASPDAPLDVLPDSGSEETGIPCTGSLVHCSDEGELVSCINGQTVEEPCPLGCDEESLRCRLPVPSNVEPQLWTKAYADVSVSSLVTIDTDECDVTAFSPAPQKELVEVADGPDLCVLIMANLHVDPAGRLEAQGARALVLLVSGEARVEGIIDASSRGSTPGPGGAPGGQPDQSAPNTPCGGGGGENNGTRDSGGGGGGGGASGGAGSDGGSLTTGGAGGTVLGNPHLVPLQGGCGGGGGGSQPGEGAGGAGGAGGGAIQVTARRSIVVAEGGLIWAGGGGGEGGGAQSAGGGGGAGGGILLEAPTVTIEGNVAANGGGGGASNNPGAGDGQDGTTDISRAAGGPDSGNGSESGGPGGAGSGSGSCRGGQPPSRVIDNGGGGGGAVGYVRVNTESGVALVSGLISPSWTGALTYGRLLAW